MFVKSYRVPCGVSNIFCVDFTENTWFSSSGIICLYPPLSMDRMNTTFRIQKVQTQWYNSCKLTNHLQWSNCSVLKLITFSPQWFDLTSSLHSLYPKVTNICMRFMQLCESNAGCINLYHINFSHVVHYNAKNPRTQISLTKIHQKARFNEFACVPMYRYACTWYVQKPTDSWGACLHKMTNAHLVRGGGG